MMGTDRGGGSDHATAEGAGAGLVLVWSTQLVLVLGLGGQRVQGDGAAVAAERATAEGPATAAGPQG